jgi:protein tyrosine phosphatase (PTP) superfamily phosphohydrolase (DUF442 family)
MPMRRVVRVVRWVVRAALVLGLLAAGYLAYDQATGNFGAVVTGRVYRSGQMGGPALGRTIRHYQIKTVLNLRGPNPGQAWYRDERAATTGAGATQVDVAMSSCEWMSRAQMRALVHALDTCDRPLLIHCQWGSERTGLVAAFSELLRPGATLADAEKQFSIFYLYLKTRDGKVMAGHLDQYKGWLAARGWSHTPERFRLWAAVGFTPGTPNREQWPYDPYPLVVVTRPEGGHEVKPLAGAGAQGVKR